MATQLLHNRNHIDEVHTFVNPWAELNAGLWSLFAGATIFLLLRVWCKTKKRSRLWYDDYILIVSWLVLLANNSLIVYQFANGYVLRDSTEKWDEPMRILINISSCGTLIGQAWTKTAFGVTLLRISSQWQKWTIWFCILTMNLFMFFKVLLQWAQVWDKDGYQNSWRLNFCVNWTFREEFKEGGNVYNIIMDFVFATFPWVITRKLEMRRVEKIGLCATMSLGILVAIVSAIRVSWKDTGNERDEYYIFRNGVSQVWYSSEITGTIIVQCIPILRPILREFKSTFVSRHTNSTGARRQSASWVTTKFSSVRASLEPPSPFFGAKGNERIVLQEITEEETDDTWNRKKRSQETAVSDVEQGIKASEPSSPFEGSWSNEMQHLRPEISEGSPKSLDFGLDARSPCSLTFNTDGESQKGLSLPPQR